MPLSQPDANIDAERPLFTATMAPYRSLSRRGFNILMSMVGVVSFLIGVGFLIMGAWPVFGFFGLDAALIYFAFRRNYLDARAFEQISLSRDQLKVRQVSAHGRSIEHDFNPYWTRLIVERRSWGVSALLLASSGKRLAIGGYLSPDDRAPFAEALSKALSLARTDASPA